MAGPVTPAPCLTAVAAAAAADPLYPLPLSPVGLPLDGSLAACGGMDRMEGFDTSAHGLCPLECAEVGGLVFVRFEPPAPAAGSAGPSPTFTSWPSHCYLRAWKRQKWPIRRLIMVGAGWKVVWENNRECWHCHVGHPEYIKSHFDTANTASAEVQRADSGPDRHDGRSSVRSGRRRCL